MSASSTDLSPELNTDPAAFLVWVRRVIPLTDAMQIERLDFDGQTLRLRAPLAPNVNDKGTGFGGSLATLATLAGWALTTLYLRRQGLDCDVVIADSQLSYHAPVTGDFEALVSLPEEPACQLLLQRLAQGGRGRLALTVVIRSAGVDCLTLSGRYVATRRGNPKMP